MPEIEIYRDRVIICGMGVMRPSSIAPSQWLAVWELISKATRAWRNRKTLMKITTTECGYCGADLTEVIAGHTYTKRIGVYDMDLDCVVAYECPFCKAREPRSAEEIKAIADPFGF